MLFLVKIVGGGVSPIETFNAVAMSPIVKMFQNTFPFLFRNTAAVVVLSPNDAMQKSIVPF